jgi:hypothetical protein
MSKKRKKTTTIVKLGLKWKQNPFMSTTGADVEDTR